MKGARVWNPDWPPRLASFAAAGIACLLPDLAQLTHAQPQSTDARLRIELVATGLPTGIDNLVSAMVMLDERTALLGYRATGIVRRIDLPALDPAAPVPVTAGPIVADLDIVTRTPDDGQSEFGIQGITLDPAFPAVPYVYIRYDASPTPGIDTPQSTLREFVLPGDSQSVVDRFVWDPSGNAGAGSLAFSARIHSVPVFSRYHHGGPPAFGPDGTLFIPLGDQRASINRSFNNNPDIFYQAAVIHRINADGSTPTDNPFPPARSGLSGTALWYAYGFRNTYGMAFDPFSSQVGGALWVSENGESTYDEINYVLRSANGGFSDISGPTTHALQTGNINSLIQTPGFPDSFYIEPKFSWYQTTGVTGIAFLAGSGLGSAFDSRLIVGNYNTPYLYWFNLNPARTDFVFSHPGLQDRVDDRVPSNRNPVGTESQETLLARGVGSPFAGVIAIAPSPRLRIPHILTADGRMFRMNRACWGDVAGPGLSPVADGVIDGSDFVAFINSFAIGDPSVDPVADINTDGVIDGTDFVIFINAFALGC